MSQNLTVLKKKRTTLKAACTRIRTYIDSIDELIPEVISILEERKEKLSLYWSDYNSIQFEIESLNEEEANDRVAFEDTFFDVTARLRRILSNTTNSTMPLSQAVTNTINDSHNQIRLPRLDLPKFSGNYADWFPFYDIFNSVINNNAKLSEIQKFQYLKSSVTNEAASIIQSLELSSQNYPIAWNLLKQRYDNKRTIVNMHLRSLFELPTLSKENATELRQIADGVTKHLQALSALQRPTNNWDDIIIYLICSKLDTITSREWQNSLSGSELPTLKQFIDFLIHRCQVLEATGKLNTSSISNSRSQLNKKQTVHVASVQTHCSHCKGNHLIYYCPEFLKLSVPQRISEARKHKLCTNCLRVAKHTSIKCNSGSCKTCGNKHNSLLHLPPKQEENVKQADNNSQSQQSQSISEKTTVATHYSSHYNGHILLSTAVVLATDANKHKQSCRILLDNGSQANFITRSCVKRLHLSSIPDNITISGITGLTSSSNEVVQIKLHSRLNNYSIEDKFIITDRITDRLPSIKIKRSDICIPENVDLADPEFYNSSDIDILIGAELFWNALCVGKINSCKDHPTMHKTRYGWIVTGRFQQNLNKNNSISKAFHTTVSNVELHDQLSRFWHLEEVPSINNTYSTDEQLCEEHFLNNTRLNDQQRIIVKLPIKQDKLASLGDTRDIAISRFHKLEKRLKRFPSLKLQYTDFIHEYLTLGHMRSLNDNIDHEEGSPTYYLPHHSVLKPTSETTKLRVVFDGSCKSTTGIALNDILMIGPTVQQNLLSIILRFRIFKFVFTADITKIYRQILIDPTQTKLQRIVWRDDESQQIQTYELLTVTYGTSAAPYLATRSLNYLAELHAQEYPVGAEHIINDFYVDDLLTGADTIQEAIRIRNEVIAILAKGSFT